MACIKVCIPILECMDSGSSPTRLPTLVGVAEKLLGNKLRMLLCKILLLDNVDGSLLGVCYECSSGS